MNTQIAEKIVTTLSSNDRLITFGISENRKTGIVKLMIAANIDTTPVFELFSDEELEHIKEITTDAKHTVFVIH